MIEILIIIMCGFTGSFFYTLSIPSNDTLIEIVIGTGLGACFSIGIALILYDFLKKQRASAGLAMFTAAFGNDFSKKVGKKLIEKYTDIELE